MSYFDLKEYDRAAFFTKNSTSSLCQLGQLGQLAGYGLFVYGVVLRRLHLPELAIPALCEAMRLKPANWGAWLELSCLEAVKIYDGLSAASLGESTYIMAQV